MTTALVPMTDLQRMAQAVAQSKLFGVTNVEQALALMLVAQAEGLHPATAARDYHIIQGRPALKADAMLARYLNSGGKVEWHEHTDEKVAATFTHPAGGTLKIEWDMARAKTAGLGGKDMWAKYPRQMLRARVISEGIRATNPAVATGLYTPEEVHDMDINKPARRSRATPTPSPAEMDMGDADVVPPEEGAFTVQLLTDTQKEQIHTKLSECNVELAALLKKANLADLSELASSDVPGALVWISKQTKRAA